MATYHHLCNVLREKFLAIIINATTMTEIERIRPMTENDFSQFFLALVVILWIHLNYEDVTP